MAALLCGRFIDGSRPLSCFGSLGLADAWQFQPFVAGHVQPTAKVAVVELPVSFPSITVVNDPGKPWQNDTDESFNGKFREECLSIEWFRSRREAAVLIEAWRNHYNEVRPHSSLQYLTLSEFKQELRLELQPPVF